jgi:16S rRNA (uracil1498-N3)-methyltransferase
VTMRTILARGLHAGRFPLDAASSHHLKVVLRLREGAVVRALDPDASVSALATLVSLEPVVCLDVKELTQEERTARSLIWIQGLPKGDKADAIVRDATELGAAEIRFAQMDRCVRVLDGGRQEKSVIRWQKIAEEAAKQCKRSNVPKVHGPQALEALLDALPKEAVHRILFYEQAAIPVQEPLMTALRDHASPIVFAAGPEGGVTEEEVTLFTQAGFQVCSLGPVILRTETVAAAALGAVRLWEG